MNGHLVYGLNLFHLQGDNMIMVAPVDGRMMNVNTGKIENTGVELQMTYRISPMMILDANYSFLNMKNSVIGSPEHKLHVGVNVSKGAWNLSSGVQYVGGLYKSVDPDIQEDYLLWNIRGAYRMNNCLKFWVNGENLLGQNYEVMNGYLMPKVTMTGGVTINF